MGNQASGAAFPYTIGKEVEGFGGGGGKGTLYRMYEGTDTATGADVTIFSYDKTAAGGGGGAAGGGGSSGGAAGASLPSSPAEECAKNYVSKLRSFKFPQILRFINSAELPNVIYLVTEPVFAFRVSDTAPAVGAARAQTEDNQPFPSLPLLRERLFHFAHGCMTSSHPIHSTRHL